MDKRRGESFGSWVELKFLKKVTMRKVKSKSTRTKLKRKHYLKISTSYLSCCYVNKKTKIYENLDQYSKFIVDG